MSESITTLVQLIKELEQLQEAKKILDRVWSETDPYNNQFSKELDRDLRAFYGFDDSE